MSVVENYLEINMLSSIEEMEWSKSVNARFKEGFVDGKFQGSQKTVQNGFDEGYAKGFEVKFPISIIKGLLAVNEMILKESSSPLLQKSISIRSHLENFEKRYENVTPTFSLSSSDIVDENLNSSYSMHHEVSFDIDCHDSFKTLSIDESESKPYELDFCDLKEEILKFVSDCKQFLILNQLREIFEDLQSCHNLCSGKCKFISKDQEKMVLN